MTTSHWMRTHSYQIQEISTDVLIVGAGYAGLSTAYWLSELKPGIKITIVDRAQAGSGASGRNAGFLTKGSAAFFNSLVLKWGENRALEIMKFASESVELVYQRVIKSSPEIKFERTSSMTLFQTNEVASDWRSNKTIQEKFDFTWKSSEELPGLLGQKFSGGLESMGEYKINPIQLLSSLKKILESRKVVFQENSSVFELLPEGVLTENNRIKAQTIILALNGYFPQFSKSFSGLIFPKRAQMLAVELQDELPLPHLYYDPMDKIYWRKEQEKVLVIGGKRLLDEAGENSDFEKVSPAIQNGLETYLKEKLEVRYKVLNRWSGIMGFTEHELPLVQKVASPCDTYIMGGFSGHGMGFGFKSGLEMAEIVTGKKSSSFFQQFGKTEITL